MATGRQDQALNLFTRGGQVMKAAWEADKAKRTDESGFNVFGDAFFNLYSQLLEKGKHGREEAAESTKPERISSLAESSHHQNSRPADRNHRTPRNGPASIDVDFKGIAFDAISSFLSNKINDVESEVANHSTNDSETADDRSTSSEATFHSVPEHLLTSWLSTVQDGEAPLLYQNLHTFLVEKSTTADRHNPGSNIGSRFLPSLEAHLKRFSGLEVVPRLLERDECRKELLKIVSDLNLSDNLRTLQALDEDEEQISNLLEGILSSDFDKEIVTSLRGEDALRFINLIQHVLEKFSWPSDSHEAARRLQLKLTKACGLLPSFLSLQGVQLLDTQRPVADGAFCEIFRAAYRSQTVALKRIKMFQTNQEGQNIIRMVCKEALIWKNLNHPFLLPFIGIDSETFDWTLCLVSPWMKRGTIMMYIEHLGVSNVNTAKLVSQIAQGIEYLHSQNVVHGDISGKNILIDDKGNAVVADFGLAVFAEATITTRSTRRGTTRWMAPELLSPASVGLQSSRRTRATDVYAFGCLCLEIYTGSPPFTETRNEMEVAMKVVNGSRPARPSEDAVRTIPDELWRLIESCWQQNPADRLGMGDVVASLSR